jgi:NAD(P)H-hydrate epimerase
MLEVTKDILNKIYKKRPEESKKYDFGLLVVIGGSEFYSGSPALNALAAFRAGVDMVRIIAPKRAADIIASFSPDLAAYPLEGKWLERKHLPILIEMTESAKEVSHGKTAVVIGGGIGRSEETQKAIQEYLARISLPVVVDADAIHAVSKKPGIILGPALSEKRKGWVITPHTYEFFILTGREIYQSPIEEKIKAVKEEAARLKTTILLKGRTDIISDGKEVALNKTGGPFLTVGGTGDTLAGICGALLARGIEPFLAAQAAAFVNGLAGEIAFKKLGEGLVATDLINSIPEVIKY